MPARDAGANHPQAGDFLSCWYCERKLELDFVLRDGILRGRDEARGGPFRLYYCTSCNRQNHCEKSRKGRWFSSPPFQPHFLEYLLGKFVGEPRDFLRATAWFRDHEERRRYFFERDGDRRYTSGAWWRRLIRREKAAAGEGGDGLRGARSEGAAGHEESGGPGRGDHARQRRRSGGLIAPWEVLGVAPDAGESEIRRAFHRLAIEHHPDKVHHLGEAFEKRAHAKFTELQRAYEELLAERARRGPERSA